MLAPSVKTALAELANSPDVERTRACLDRVSTALIRSPEDGAALVRVLGADVDAEDGEDPLLRILSAALDAARMAQQKDQARGAILIETLGDEMEELVAEDTLTMTGTLALSRA